MHGHVLMEFSAVPRLHWTLTMEFCAYLLSKALVALLGFHAQLPEAI
jgi:hypothetical protein